MLTFKRLIFFIFISLLAYTSSEIIYKRLTRWKVEEMGIVKDVSKTNEQIRYGTVYFDTNLVYIVEMEMKINGKCRISLYSWIGRNSKLDERKLAARHLASRIIYHRGSEILSIMRLPEGYEGCSAHFENIFPFGTLCEEPPILYKVKADNTSSYIVKVPATVEQLNHNYSFLLQVKSKRKIYIWHGYNTTQENRVAVDILRNVIEKINRFREGETEIDDFLRILGGSEENTYIAEELSADDQELEAERYSSKYRMIKMYINDIEEDKSEVLNNLYHICQDSTYFLMDTLTGEKFIFLGHYSSEITISNAMEKAEQYIMELPSNFPMMRIVRQPNKLYSQFVFSGNELISLPIPFNPPINFVILFPNPLSVISLLEKKWIHCTNFNYEYYEFPL